MPSIWITSNPRSERSRAIHSFSRAADSATKRREPVFRRRSFPTGKSLLLAIEATKARAFNLHLAAVKANLAFRLAPAMRPSVLAARVSRAARRSRVVFHHLGKWLAPSGKAETFETRRHIR